MAAFGVAVRLCIACALASPMLPAMAQHQHHGAASATVETEAPAPTFIASTAKPFPALMDDAMAVMDYGMRHAPMNGVSEHDFVTMMMPHHQGGVDMAKAILLTTQDPEIRNLALGIIAEQQNEINVMKAWLQRHPQQENK